MDKSSWAARVRLVERYRWLMLIPLCLAFAVVCFHRATIGVVADSLMRDYNIEQAAELGLLSSIYFYTYAFLQIPVGLTADRRSPRRTISFAIVTMACGTLLFGLAPNLYALYAGRFMIGLGAAFIYINMVKIFADWFRSREFGMITTLASGIGNGGLIVAATPLAMVVDAVGWRSSFVLLGAVTLLVAAGCWWFVRSRPADKGWPSIQDIESAEDAAAAAYREPASSIVDSVKAVMTNWYTWPPMLAAVGVYGVYMTFVGVWGVPFLMQIYGMSRVAAASHMVAAMTGYVLTGPVLGIISDRLLTRKWPYAGSFILELVAWLALTFWNDGRPPEWALYPLCFLLGMGASALALTIACAKDVNSPALTGLVAGTVNTGPFIGAALMQPLFGWVLDQGWQGAVSQGAKLYPLDAFRTAFLLCSCVLAMAAGLALMVRETHCRNISGVLTAPDGGKSAVSGGRRA